MWLLYWTVELRASLVGGRAALQGGLGLRGREEPIVDHGGKEALELIPAYCKEACLPGPAPCGGSRDDIN